MAITKVGKSGGASGAIDYLLKQNKEAEKNPQMIGGNVATFGTKDDVKKDFDYYSNLRPRVKNQVVHLSISLPIGEHLDEVKKIDFSEKLLEKLNFKTDKVPYLIVEHHDKEYEHWHVLAGRISDDGKTVTEWQIAERAINATKELEKQFGLEQIEYNQSEQRQIKKGEYKLIERTEELSVMVQAKIVIDESLAEKSTTRSFVESLQQNGFEVRPNVSGTTGKMNGFSFKKDEVIFKSSALGKQYSFQNLQKNGLDYNQERDTDYLIEVKRNEPAEKLAIENGRDRTVKTNESFVGSSSVESERTNPVFTGSARLPDSNLERTGETKSIAEREESLADAAESIFDRTENFTKPTKSIADGTKSVTKDRINEPAGESTFDERTNSEIVGRTEASGSAKSANSEFIESTRANSDSAERTNLDDYFNPRRNKNGDQENKVQYLDQHRVFDNGGGSPGSFTDIAAPSQFHYEEIFSRQLEISQSDARNSAAEKAGVEQRIEDFRLEFERISNVNFKPLDASLIEQSATISMQTAQNNEELNKYVFAAENSESEILDIDLDFRMETPQFVEPKQDEIEDEMEDEMEEEYEVETGSRLSI